MKLSLEQIKEITCGAVNVCEKDGAFRFCRFTDEQRETYRICKPNRPDFYDKTLATAGVKLRFVTDSQKMFLKINILDINASSRCFYSFDVFKNGKMIGAVDNFSDVEFCENYTAVKFPLTCNSGEFDLGQGEKTVCVHFPFSVAAEILELSLDDGAIIKPVKPSKKMLCFGDSITHGYDALHPSGMYTAKLAETLGAEEYNKGIGGDIFFPELADTKDPIDPDYITVAYGTNDWSGCPREATRSRIKGFYENLRKNYPNAKIFAIIPIWRADCDEEKTYGKFELVACDIREICTEIGGITVIEGIDLVPHDPEYFGDFRLHPNEKGFEEYFKNLYKEIKKHI